MKLDFKHRIAFAAACCERLLPHYIAFTRETSWGDAQKLANILDMIWKHIEEKEIAKKELQKLSSDCEKIIPDADAFTGVLKDYAQDASIAVCLVLDYLLTNNIDSLVYVAEHAVDTVDLYVQESENMDSNDPKLEDRISRHPLMQKELAKQGDDLNLLAKTELLTTELLHKLRLSSKGSNIGLSI